MTILAILLILSHIGAYKLGKHRAKPKLVRCSHYYEIIEEQEGEHIVWVCRHCGDIIEINIEK